MDQQEYQHDDEVIDYSKDESNFSHYLRTHPWASNTEK